MWKPTTFCNYGTPVVQIRKKGSKAKPTGKLRFCGDYPVYVNRQLAPHLHIAQGMYCDNAYKSGKKSPATILKVLHEYKVGRPVYVSHYGRKIDKTPRWAPVIVSKRLGTRHLLVKVLPQGPVWRHHIEQARPRYGDDQDTDPDETASSSSSSSLLKPPSTSTCWESVERPMVSGLQLQS